MPSNGDHITGRVTTKEFYEALLSVKNEFSNMERRVVDRLDDTNKQITDVNNAVIQNTNGRDNNTKEINTLRKRSNISDALIATGTMIAAFFGIRNS